MVERLSEAYEVAYILKGFPRLSETFISNEVLLLEGKGLPLRLYCIKQGDQNTRHAWVEKIRAPRKYLPVVGSVSGMPLSAWLARYVWSFIPGHLAVAAKRPAAYVRTLCHMLSMARIYRQKQHWVRKSMVKEFCQAGYIAFDILQRPQIRHLHGHFCHGATTVTWFVSLLTGLPFSFTAHAKDLYDQSLNPGDLLDRKIAAARFLTTCTEANAQYLRDDHDCGQRVHKIYHGLDTHRFSPLESTSEANAKPLILSVGRAVEKKGFLTLIDACALLRDAGKHFSCLIIGESGDCSAAITERIERLDLARYVTVRGPATQEELRVLYSTANVFALPCQLAKNGDRDGIPNVLVEAMAMGLPVVSTPVSGIPELIDHECCGLLVPERDPQALYAALLRVLYDPALAQRLGRAARDTVCRKFDATRTIKPLHSLFVAALSESTLSQAGLAPKSHRA